MSSVNNNIPFVPENTIDPAAGLNESINVIDALLQIRVVSVGDNTPPGSPADGARYIVGTSPTGAWAGQANKLARWLDGMWTFFDARYAVNAEDGLLYIRSGTTWSPISGNVAGPVSSTDNDIARFDGITGKLLKAGLKYQTSMNDTTAGSLMAVGAFGLGATAANTINNPDDALTLANGWYTSVGSNFASQPYGTDTVYLLHFRGSVSAVQIAQRAQTVSGMKFRLYSGGSWGAWAEAWSSTGSNRITVDTGSLGFGTGSGGTVTQATSKATPVTLNKPTGRITMNAAALNAGDSVTFTVNNSMVAATDCVICNAGSGFTNYRVETANVGSSAFNIRVTNVSAGSLSEAVTINFCVIKGAIA